MRQLIELLHRHEGMRLKPYKDSVGKLTIGIGRNLDDNGISEVEADFLLKNDLIRCFEEAQKFDWFVVLNDARACVIVSMIFNLGLPRFLGFKNMIKALEEERYEDASKEMLDSVWAKQVGRRADELSEMMKTGLISI
jgi:lysozyme